MAAVFAVLLASTHVLPIPGAEAAPSFSIPFSCEQTSWRAWTRPGHVPSENAIDFFIPGSGDVGQPVRASASGTVVFPAYTSSANPLAINHDGGSVTSGWSSLYLHMSSPVANGTVVERGDIIGYVSDVGSPGSVHLHYEQRLNWGVVASTFSNWTPPYGSAMTDPNSVSVPDSDSCSGVVGEGSLISATDTGEVYVIAGGAPVYIGDPSLLTRPVAQRTRAEIQALRRTPSDGTLIRTANGPDIGRVYVMAGGAPLHIADGSIIGQTPIDVDHRAVDSAGSAQWSNIATSPADGTLIRTANGPSLGRVYVMAGGAPLYIADGSMLGGVTPTNVDHGVVDAPGTRFWTNVRLSPADGTLIRTANGPSLGRVYVMAGGAPLYIADGSILGGAIPTNVDHRVVDAAGQGLWDNVQSSPVDGTFVRTANGPDVGRVYVIAGGAPLYIANGAVLDGATPTNVDHRVVDAAGQDLWDNMRFYPADQTRLREWPNGASYSVLDGVAVPAPASSGSFVLVDPQTIARAGEDRPWDHLKEYDPPGSDDGGGGGSGEGNGTRPDGGGDDDVLAPGGIHSTANGQMKSASRCSIADC